MIVSKVYLNKKAELKELDIAMFLQEHDRIESNLKEVEKKYEIAARDLEETKSIASMPSRETLLSRLVWSLQSPLSGLARFFDAAAKELETTGKTKVWELEGEKEEVKEEENKET